MIAHRTICSDMQEKAKKDGDGVKKRSDFSKAQHFWCVPQKPAMCFYTKVGTVTIFLRVLRHLHLQTWRVLLKKCGHLQIFTLRNVWI